jgi:hypothetical protein
MLMRGEHSRAFYDVKNGQVRFASVVWIDASLHADLRCASIPSFFHSSLYVCMLYIICIDAFLHAKLLEFISEIYSLVYMRIM